VTKPEPLLEPSVELVPVAVSPADVPTSPPAAGSVGVAGVVGVVDAPGSESVVVGAPASSKSWSVRGVPCGDGSVESFLIPVGSV
jgi:hypothetical protein